MNIFQLLTMKSETAYLDKDMTVRQAIEKMDVHKYSVIPVLDKEGHYLGSISEGDLLRYIKNEAHFNIDIAETETINEVIRYRPYESLNVNSSLEDLYQLSLRQNFVPIIDDRNVFIGIIKRKVIIEALLKEDKH